MISLEHIADRIGFWLKPGMICKPGQGPNGRQLGDMIIIISIEIDDEVHVSWTYADFKSSVLRWTINKHTKLHPWTLIA